MVVYYGKMVEECGLDGVVCLVYEIKVIYEVVWLLFLIVMFGICIVSDVFDD